MPTPAPAADAASPDAAPPSLDQARELAYAALLDYARRNDHAHALATLMRALASLTGEACWLWPQPPGGDLSMPPIHAQPAQARPDAPGQAPLPSIWPCTHSGTVIGELRMHAPAGLSYDEWGERLLPVRDAAAALLAGLVEHAGHALPGSLALQRTAMHEAEIGRAHV